MVYRWVSHSITHTKRGKTGGVCLIIGLKKVFFSYAERIKYYRDGMQGWVTLGLTTVTDVICEIVSLTCDSFKKAKTIYNGLG